MEKDKNIKRLLSESLVEIPFADFEDRLMQKVHEEAKEQRSILKNMRLSWLFFTVGSLFGIFATTLLPAIEQSIWGLEIKSLQLPIFLLLAFVILWQFEALIKFTAKHFSKKAGS